MSFDFLRRAPRLGVLVVAALLLTAALYWWMDGFSHPLPPLQTALVFLGSLAVVGLLHLLWRWLQGLKGGE